MRGGDARFSKIVRRGDDAAAKMMLPDPVDHDAGGQGIFGAGDPSGQFKAKSVGVRVCRRLGWRRPPNCQEMRVNFGFGVAALPLEPQHVHLRDLRPLFRTANAHSNAAIPDSFCICLRLVLLFLFVFRQVDLLLEVAQFL